MAEWLESLTHDHLPLVAVGSSPPWGEKIFMWGSLPAGLRMVGGSTRVLIWTWNL